MAEFHILNWILASVFAVFAWFLRRTIVTAEEKIVQLEKDIHDVKLSYLHKEEFKEFKNELKGMFVELKNDLRTLTQAQQHRE